MELNRLKQELEQVNQHLSRYNAVNRRVPWLLAFSLIVCFLALVTAHFAVSAIAFIATLLCIVFWFWLYMQHRDPLENKANSLRSRINHIEEAPTKIEPRCDEDKEVDPSAEWKAWISKPYAAYWLPGETPSLQPGDVVLHYCSVGYPNYGGITRHKIERHGRIVAQCTTIHSAPFGLGSV